MNVLEILLVEDSPSDVRLIREAIREAGLPITLEVARDGVEALNYLASCERHEVPSPDLVLLDWKLPRKNGREVLSEIKASARLRNLPVLVLTSSAIEEEVNDAYALNANSFITKPADLASYLRMMRAIDAFWRTTATLAPHQSSYSSPAGMHARAVRAL